jgi:hypothetical protein
VDMVEDNMVVEDNIVVEDIVEHRYLWGQYKLEVVVQVVEHK